MEVEAVSFVRRWIKPLGQLALIKLLVIPLWSCDPLNTGFDDLEPAELYRARVISPPRDEVTQLKVMNWNAKFGGGRIDFFFDCHGDTVNMTEEQVRANLDGLVRKIRQYDPDVLMMQEIDTNSKRGAYINQVQYILDHTALNYAAYASQWRADYIPSDGIGKMDSGNVTMSKFPIHDAERIALALQDEHDAITQYFYLKRNILRTRIALPKEKQVWFLNLHADAYSKDGTKKKHIDSMEQEMDAMAARGVLFVGAGDFNTLPPGATRLNGFEDSVCEAEEFQADDFSAETEFLVPFYTKYKAFVSLEDTLADEASYFTHSTTKNTFWNRQLDYMFTNGEWVAGSGLVHLDEARGGMETMPLSDHAPVSATLEVP
jgi:endonuclease/exonuclease/phosphatase family metal-dependent hydrolase